MTDDRSSDREPARGVLLQAVIDRVHDMMRSDEDPEPGAAEEQVECAWVVGEVGRGGSVRGVPPRRHRFGGGARNRPHAFRRRANARTKHRLLHGGQYPRTDARSWGVGGGVEEVEGQGEVIKLEGPVAKTITRGIPARDWMMIGAGVGAGVGAGLLVSGIAGMARRRPSGKPKLDKPPAPAPAGQTWDEIKAALLAATAAEVIDLIGGTASILQEHAREALRRKPDARPVA
jgi:hypothetical protein